MSFKLSQRSLDNLEGVDERLVAVVKQAIHDTKVDFGVICGLRTLETQRKLVASGASQTLKSKHIDGLAVDLFAYVGSRGSWELNLYDDIADAMAQSAKNVGVGICWGAAWSTGAIPYPVDKKRAMNKRAFIDGPHFELID